MLSPRFFSFVFFTIFSCFLYFAGRTLHEVRNYFKLSEYITAHLQECAVEKTGHSFFLNGTFVVGEEKIKVPMQGPFPNSYIAEQELKSFPKGEYFLWVDKKNLHRAVFKKKFPLKALFSSLLLMSLLSYFLFLNRSVTSSSPKLKK